MPKKSYNQILDEHLHILIAQGSYDAFIRLRKRYQKHAVSLATELFQKYSYTGISFKELVFVCEDYFPFAISKYIPGLSSFYSFWKSHTKLYAVNYISDYCFDEDVMSIKGIISFDQKNEGAHSLSELIGEVDERTIKRKVFEIRYVIHKYSVFFTQQEKALLNFILQGYSLVDIINSKVLSRSQLYLTYKTAVEKVQKYIGLDK